MATSNAYGYGWKTGQRNLSLLSVGTGSVEISHTPKSFGRMPSAFQAVMALESIIADTSAQAQATLQWLGQVPAPWTIDSEAGTLADEMPLLEPMLGYQRFDIRIEKNWIRDTLGQDVTDKDIKRLGEMDRPETVPQLLDLARIAADREVTLDTMLAKADT